MNIKNLLEKLTNPVQWHEGMLLSSHHLQAADHYHVAYGNVMSKAAHYYNYGVISLKLDESQITSGQFVVHEVYGILEDGTVLAYSSDTADYKIEKNISENLKNKGTTKIYLTVMKHGFGKGNFDSTSGRYFSILTDDFSDENTGTNPINIPSKKNRIFLCTANELTPQMVAIPIAEVISDGTGVKVTDFIPPSLYILNESFLYNKINSILTMLKQRVGYILNKKNLLKNNLVLESVLRVLITEIIPVDSVLNSKYQHPFVLYQYMLRIASALLAFSVTSIIPILPSYDHKNLLVTFKTLEDHITKCITQLVEYSAALPFTLHNDMFKLRMLKDWDDKKELLLGIRRSKLTNRDDFVTWINGVQIVSEPFIDEIKQKRVLGATRKILSGDDIGFEDLDDDMVVVAVDAKSNYVVFGEDLYVFNLSYKNLPSDVLFFQKESK